MNSGPISRVTVIVIILIFTSSLFALPTGSWGFQLKVFLLFACNVFVTILVTFLPLSFLGYSQKVGQPDQTRPDHGATSAFDMLFLANRMFFCFQIQSSSVTFDFIKEAAVMKGALYIFLIPDFCNFFASYEHCTNGLKSLSKKIQQHVRGSDSAEQIYKTIHFMEIYQFSKHLKSASHYKMVTGTC